MYTNFQFYVSLALFTMVHVRFYIIYYFTRSLFTILHVRF